MGAGSSPSLVFAVATAAPDVFEEGNISQEMTPASAESVLLSCAQQLQVVQGVGWRVRGDAQVVICLMVVGGRYGSRVSHHSMGINVPSPIRAR